MKRLNMEFDEFCREHQKIWNTYLKSVYDATKGVVGPTGGKLLFPNMVMYTETEEHYIAELFGCALRFEGLTKRIHKEDSTIRYFYQFVENSNNPLLKIEGRMNIIGLTLSREIDNERVKRRFGFDPLAIHPTRLVKRGDGGAILSFGHSFQSCLFNDCLIVNIYEQIYRMKDILCANVVSKSLSLRDFVAEQREYCRWPVDRTDDLFGIHVSQNSTVEFYKLSGQFVNLFLVPGVAEPNIGKFLHNNPAILKKALNCSKLLYEKPFKWLEGTSDSFEDHIQPDFMLMSCATNYWDICDIKRPLLGKKSVIKGEHSRRRFIDSVNEGIAQLSNYEQYFSFQKNADHAKQKYGVEVKSPRLILIIGNYENADIQEIQEASRSMKDNYAIIDYDSLNAAYLAKAKLSLSNIKLDSFSGGRLKS